MSYWLKKELDPVHYSGCWHKETHLVTKKCITSHPSGWREQPLCLPDKYVCTGGCVCVSLSFTGLYCGRLLPLMLNKNKPSRLRPRLRPHCQVWDKNFGLEAETETKRSRLRDKTSKHLMNCWLIFAAEMSSGSHRAENVVVQSEAGPAATTDWCQHVTIARCHCRTSQINWQVSWRSYLILFFA